jgi:UDP-N-acetylglucosamine 2-epimerase (non-hydrolysing)
VTAVHPVVLVAGARPNFVKIAPLMRAFRDRPELAPILVHTGQHYDDKLSRVFFDELDIPQPDISLEVGSGSHAQQTAEIMRRFEPVLDQVQPHAVLVVGDVNSTAACALVSSKYTLAAPFDSTLGRGRLRPLAVHVEAGLRSHDDDMPEEINRRVTDTLSDLLFVSEPSGVENLAREGVPEARVHFVGNVMIDTLLAARERAMKSDILTRLGLAEGGYGLVTLHRPSNVDDPAQLAALLGVLDEIAHEVPLCFPVHPRTRARLAASGVPLPAGRWVVSEPVGYLDFLRLTASARLVLTDSGGVQEETTILGVRCLTLRDNTERPVTIDEGTNILAGSRRETIWPAWQRARSEPCSGRQPRYWDGKAAVRTAEVLGRAFAPMW